VSPIAGVEDVDGNSLSTSSTTVIGDTARGGEGARDNLVKKRIAEIREKPVSLTFMGPSTFDTAIRVGPFQVQAKLLECAILVQGANNLVHFLGRRYSRRFRRVRHPSAANPGREDASLAVRGHAASAQLHVLESSIFKPLASELSNGIDHAHFAVAAASHVEVLEV